MPIFTDQKCSRFETQLFLKQPDFATTFRGMNCGQSFMVFLCNIRFITMGRLVLWLRLLFESFSLLGRARMDVCIEAQMYIQNAFLYENKQRNLHGTASWIHKPLESRVFVQADIGFVWSKESLEHNGMENCKKKKTVVCGQ